MTAVISGPASRVITVTGEEGGLPAMFEDPDAPCQIRMLTDYRAGTAKITVTCTCLRDGDRQRFRHGQWIEQRAGAFPAAEAIAAHRAWHARQARQGIEAPA